MYERGFDIRMLFRYKIKFDDCMTCKFLHYKRFIQLFPATRCKIVVGLGIHTHDIFKLICNIHSKCLLK